MTFEEWWKGSSFRARYLAHGESEPKELEAYIALGQTVWNAALSTQESVKSVAVCDYCNKKNCALCGIELSGFIGRKFYVIEQGEV